VSLIAIASSVVEVLVEYAAVVTTQARQEIRTRRGLTLEAYRSA
jgi:hypothetical protein